MLGRLPFDMATVGKRKEKKIRKSVEILQSGQEMARSVPSTGVLERARAKDRCTLHWNARAQDKPPNGN